MGTGIFVVVGAFKPSQHSMKIAILAKSANVVMVIVAGGTVIVVGETVFAVDGAVSLQNR